jgi:glycosidase
MPVSVLNDKSVKDVFTAAQKISSVQVQLTNGQSVTISKPFQSPIDWRDRLMYMIMVDRFNNTKATPKCEWNTACYGRQGGTFEGITQKLDYLQELGIGALWLSPILKNGQFPSNSADWSYHGYGINNFLEIDSRFASDPTQPGLAEKELITLVDQAHARGMFIIMDIVLNHAGDLFEYCDCASNTCNYSDKKIWSDSPYLIGWRDKHGNTHCEQNFPPSDDSIDLNPVELRKNEYFRRQGMGCTNDWCKHGDFDILKEFKTEYIDEFRDKPIWNALIRSYQYIIALTDVDGFRVDTLKFIEPEFARNFSNAIREYALSIGKENFFIFGESATSDEKVLAEYTGHNTAALNNVDIIGADAQLDFPLNYKLTAAIKGFNSTPVSALKEMYDTRKSVQQHLLSTHGEAGRFFVTFLDNHDMRRFFYPGYEEQLTLSIGCLLCLLGIPCLYYGTENGLNGTKEIHQQPQDFSPEYSREAFWGMIDAFDKNHYLYQQIKAMTALKQNEPALRYGRQYFREISGNNLNFGLSKEVGGIIAFCRILNDREVTIVANTSLSQEFNGYVLVDDRINSRSLTNFKVVYSNKMKNGQSKVEGSYANFYNLQNQFIGHAYACRIPVQLDPCEIQILTQERM